MGFLDTLQRQQQAPKSMMGRANFSIQRPSPRVRLDKFKAVLDPMEDRPAPFEGQGFERLTGDPANADVNIDVNADIPMGNDLPSQGGITGRQQSDSEAEVANILAEISGIKGKDYGPRKKGGFKDILLGLGLGALQGAANSDPRGGLGAVLGGAIGGGAAGGIGGAVDGSTDNRMRDRLRLDRLYGDYGQAAKVADIEQGRAYKKKQSENIDADNIRAQKDLERKIEKDAATAAYWNRKADQGDLRIAGEEELRALRDKWATSKDKNDVRRLDLVEKEIKARNDRTAAQIQSREKIAGLSIAAQDRRAALAIEAQKEAEKLRAANASGRQAEAIKARERLAQLKKEDDELVGGN